MYLTKTDVNYANYIELLGLILVIVNTDFNSFTPDSAKSKIYELSKITNRVKLKNKQLPVNSDEKELSIGIRTLLL